MKPAEIIDVAGLEPPLPAESDPPVSVTTPVVAAPPVVVEHVQPDPLNMPFQLPSRCRAGRLQL